MRNSRSRYPLYRNSKENLKLPDNRPIQDLSIENLAEGSLENAHLGISGEVLEIQAEVADKNGFPQLAQNLRRAAEMTIVPDRELLDIYQALRPGRLDRQTLEKLAKRLEDNYDATLTAAFVREAAEKCSGD